MSRVIPAAPVAARLAWLVLDKAWHALRVFESDSKKKEISKMSTGYSMTKPQLWKTLNYDGHVVRIFQRKSSLSSQIWYLVTVDCESPDDNRSRWAMTPGRAAGITFLDLAGFEWD